MLVGLIFVEALEPFIAGDISGTNPAKRMENSLSQRRNWPALAERSARLSYEIDGQKLQEKELVSIGMPRQEILTIPLRLQSKPVIICMADSIIKRILPTQHTKNIQENLI